MIVLEREIRDAMISLHDHFPIRITDWLMSAILFSWGLTLFALDPEVWALPIYSGLSVIFDQYTWAVIGTAVGVARLVALLVNGAVRPSPHLRGIGAAIGGLIWLQLWLSQLFSEAAGLAVAIYPWLVVADALNVYRAAKDARVSDHKAKQRRKTAARRVPGRT